MKESVRMLSNIVQFDQNKHQMNFQSAQAFWSGVKLDKLLLVKDLESLSTDLGQMATLVTINPADLSKPEFILGGWRQFVGAQVNQAISETALLAVPFDVCLGLGPQFNSGQELPLDLEKIVSNYNLNVTGFSIFDLAQKAETLAVYPTVATIQQLFLELPESTKQQSGLGLASKRQTDNSNPSQQITAVLVSDGNGINATYKDIEFLLELGYPGGYHITDAPEQLVSHLVSAVVAGASNVDIDSQSKAATAAQAAGLQFLTTLNGQFAVADTLVHILGHLEDLETVSSHLTKITVTNINHGSHITVTAEEFYTAPNAMRLMSGINVIVTDVSAKDSATLKNASGISSILVSDMAEEIVANLSNLEGLVDAGLLDAIYLTDDGVATLTIEADQFEAAALVICEITDDYKLTLTGDLPATQAAIATQFVTHLSTENTFSVVGTATEIQDAMGVLQMLARANVLNVIRPETGAMTITSGQLTSDAETLNKIEHADLTVTGVKAKDAKALAGYQFLSGSTVTSIIVTDEVDAILQNLDTLSELAHANILDAVHLAHADCPTLEIEAAQLTSAAPVLTRISNHYLLHLKGTLLAIHATVGAQFTSNYADNTLVIQGTATEVQDSLGPLQVMATKINTITITSGSLTITAGQLSSDINALHKIKSAKLTVTDVTAGEATHVSTANFHGGSVIQAIQISDLASEIVSHLTVLEELVRKGILNAVRLTDEEKPTVNLDAELLATAAPVLAKITDHYRINLSGDLSAVDPTIAAQFVSLLVYAEF